MSAIKPPARKEKTLGIAPTYAPDNIPDAGKLSDIGFKVDARLRDRYKKAAVLSGISMKKLMEESFELWIEKKGIREILDQIS
jgi:hypothetical protein